nr:alpha-hydroxy acid oxidase [Halomonas socia]
MSIKPSPVSSRRYHRIAERCRSIEDLRQAAARRLPRGIFDFVDGGAEDERTLGGNRESFALFRFRPRTLVNVTNIDTSTDILGSTSSLPLIAGPTGAVGFSWPRGDLAVARAAAEAGVPYTLSSSASVSIEDIAAAKETGRRWFQCYIFKQRDYTRKLIERARQTGYDTLVITVDLPVGGNRERDYRNDFAVPFSYTPRNVLDFVRHPRWAFSTLYHGTPEMANITDFDGAKNVSEAASSVGRNYDAGFDWDGLREIRDLWHGKLIVKGIARADDACHLVELGVDAVAVSNHGGRQLDGAIPTLLCLPPVAAAVDGRIPVFVDGGIRRGADVITALALGADAVLIGRPVIYGIAAAGPAGVHRTLDILRQELTRVMQLCGVTRISQITPDLIASEDIARQFDTTTTEWLMKRSEVVHKRFTPVEQLNDT